MTTEPTNATCAAVIGARVYVEAMDGRGGGYFGTLTALTSRVATVTTPKGTRCWAGIWERDVVSTCLPCQVRVCPKKP